jgi:pimeloyl-ACP methyl ester carboxylesterase
MRVFRSSYSFLHLLLIAQVVTGFRSYRFKDLLNSPPDISNEEVPDSNSADVVTDYLEQPLDHFDDHWSTRVNASLRQQFFYSGRHVNDTANLPTYAFLCVGGEGPALSVHVLINSVHCSGDMLELARKLSTKANIHLFALEHRYYGLSYPKFFDDQGNSVPALATENIVFLSSRQALADVAHFVQTRDLPSNTKWVTFGGSYPGFLAAMARQFYPTLIHAAVSSSAPMHIILDFVGYKERQAWDLQYDAIGGRSECLKIVLDGHAELIHTLDNNHTHVAKMFQACNSSTFLDMRNVQVFLGDGVVDIPAQSNDPSCSEALCNLEKVCDYLVASKNAGNSAMESLALLSNEQQTTPCIDVDWRSFLEHMSSTVIEREHWRSWVWQTCTEFGYYQTCEEDSICPFGRGLHPIDMDFEICQVAYNLTQKEVEQNVAKTVEWYGDVRKRATRVLSVNGDVDPWSVLAILDSDNPLMPAHIVKGASHHFWTHASKGSDNQEVRDARDIIHLKVMEWLEQPLESFIMQASIQATTVRE